MAFLLDRSARRGFLKALTLASVLTATMATMSASHADTLDQVKAKKVLKVGVFQDYPPFGSVGSNMQLQGFDIDLAAVLAKKLGAQAELVPVNGTNRVAYLADHKVDMLLSVGLTPAREKVLDFSRPYAPYYIAVFGPKSMTVTTASDLSGKLVGTAGGTNEDLSLTKVAPPTVTIKRFDDQSGAISAYLSGQVQLISLGGDVAARVRNGHPNASLDEKIRLMNSPMRLAVNKGDGPLRDALDTALDQARADGEMDVLAKKWLGGPMPATF